MSFAVVGDILLGDQPLTSGIGIGSWYHGEYGAAFSEFAAEAGQYEFVAGNFEGVLIDPRSPGPKVGACMTAPASAIHALRSANITHLSVANNHSMEYGAESFRAMLALFEDGGLTTFGQISRPYVVVKTLVRTVGLLGFSTVPAFYGTAPGYLFVNTEDEGSVRGLVSLISEARRNCEFLVVMPHWGCEFVTAPSAVQIDLARRLLAAGCDLIAGSHPHVVQKSYAMNGSYVFFSMGNLLSDYWQERITENLVLEVDISGTTDIRVHRFSTDRRFRIRRMSEPVSATAVISDGVPAIIDDEQYRAIVSLERARVRRESILFLLRNAPKVIRRPLLLFWALRRAWYLARNAGNLRRDPSQIYSGPMH